MEIRSAFPPQPFTHEGDGPLVSLRIFSITILLCCTRNPPNTNVGSRSTGPEANGATMLRTLVFFSIQLTCDVPTPLVVVFWMHLVQFGLMSRSS